VNPLFDNNRRTLLKAVGLSALSGALPTRALALAPAVELTAGTLRILSDGNLQLPSTGMFENAEQEAEAQALFKAAGMSLETREPPLNITLWKSENRTVLFDVGSGTQFMETAGELPLQLEEAGVDPADVTDVVFTHAHPDHCWGLIDDFDELLCPNATYHMHGAEYDHWMSEDTLANTPEAGLAFVAGARNRLPLIEEQLNRFSWGDELVPGIEAIDTHGHTPGHSSFIIHSGSDQVLVVGDALIHQVISFQRPSWKWRSDSDATAAAATRVALLDRLVADKMKMIAYHLPAPGFGHVERKDSVFQYVSDTL